MKQGMKYDTNHYQLREIVLSRMIQIIKNQIYSKSNGVVFFGDSLIELCDLDTYYPELDNKYNNGICGINSGTLLNFIDEGVIKYNPSKVVILVGTNDLGDTTQASPRDIALNIKEMVEIIHYNLLNTKIYICSPIPCVETKQGYKYTNKGIRSNDILKIVYRELQNVIPYDYCAFIDIYTVLCDKDKVIEDYFIDGLHINDEGYRLICKQIKKAIL